MYRYFLLRLHLHNLHALFHCSAANGLSNDFTGRAYIIVRVSSLTGRRREIRKRGQLARLALNKALKCGRRNETQ